MKSPGEKQESMNRKGRSNLTPPPSPRPNIPFLSCVRPGVGKLKPSPPPSLSPTTSLANSSPEKMLGAARV